MGCSSCEKRRREREAKRLALLEAREARLQEINAQRAIDGLEPEPILPHDENLKLIWDGGIYNKNMNIIVKAKQILPK